MKKEIPTPVFVIIIVLLLLGIGFYMFQKSNPQRRPEGAPSNLQRAVEGMAKERGIILHRRNRKDD